MALDVVQAGAGVAAIAAGVAGGAYLVRGGWRATRTVQRLATGLLGDRETGQKGVVERLDGIDGRLAALAANDVTIVGQVTALDGRLQRVEAQVHPNGGASLHDQVTRIREAVTNE